MAHPLTLQVSSALAAELSTAHAGALVSFAKDFTRQREEGVHFYCTISIKATSSVQVREACPPQPPLLIAAQGPPFLNSPCRKPETSSIFCSNALNRSLLGTRPPQ